MDVILVNYYSFEALQPTDQYYAHWVDFQRKERLSGILQLLFLPIMFVVLVILIFFNEHLNNFAFAFFLAAPAVVLWRLEGYPCRLRCPRCRKRFYFDRMLNPSPYLDRCAHCQLPKYAPNES